MDQSIAVSASRRSVVTSISVPQALLAEMLKAVNKTGRAARGDIATITVSIPYPLLQALDELVKRRGEHVNRGVLVRLAISKAINFLRESGLYGSGAVESLGALVRLGLLLLLHDEARGGVE
ncbi:MAG: ribbon-helix-helix domain-containing protein [Thermocladium sp.]